METTIKKIGLVKGTYIEPFAGGAGIAIELLEKNIVNQIVINDLDKGIYSFWRAILTETDRFIENIRRVPLTITEWKKQREICLNNNSKYSFELGFATFYMNRTNHSGIIKGGVIGGIEQNGEWKINARFNKEALINRITKIAQKKDSIKLYNKDFESFIINYLPKYENSAFIYFDPPYYEKGKQLYLNFFDYYDHVRIEKIISTNVNCDWIITYDDSAEIAKLYTNHNLMRYELNYSVCKKKKAKELIIFKNDRMIPNVKELNSCNCNINLERK